MKKILVLNNELEFSILLAREIDTGQYEWKHFNTSDFVAELGFSDYYPDLIIWNMHKLNAQAIDQVHLCLTTLWAATPCLMIKPPYTPAELFSGLLFHEGQIMEVCLDQDRFVELLGKGLKLSDTSDSKFTDFFTPVHSRRERPVVLYLGTRPVESFPHVYSIVYAHPANFLEKASAIWQSCPQLPEAIVCDAIFEQETQTSSYFKVIKCLQRFQDAYALPFYVLGESAERATHKLARQLGARDYLNRVEQFPAELPPPLMSLSYLRAEEPALSLPVPYSLSM